MIYNKITDKPRWTDEDLFQSFRAQIDNSIERGWKREDIIIGTNFDFRDRQIGKTTILCGYQMPDNNKEV